MRTRLATAPKWVTCWPRGGPAGGAAGAHHVSKGKPYRGRAISLKVPAKLPRILTVAETQVILDACTRLRDRFFFSLLYESGTARGAMAWLRREQPAGDEVDVLDRLFLLRFHGDLLDLPRSPDIAAGAADDDKPGTWYVVRADSPADAFSHMRQALAGGYACANAGRCRQCPVEVIGSGSWQEVMDLLAKSGVTVSKHEVPDVRVPARMGWPRGNRILGNGSWDIPAEARA